MPEKYPVIAAVRTVPELKAAYQSKVETIFLLNASILNIAKIIEEAKNYHKNIYVHIDLTEGIGKDAAGLQYLSSIGLYGIISTKNNIIKQAKEFHLKTIQRLFVLDSQSVISGLSSLSTNRPDYIEIMPALVPKVIKIISENKIAPVIAGGLVDTLQEARLALQAGAAAVSTSKAALWSLERDAFL